MVLGASQTLLPTQEAQEEEKHISESGGTGDGSEGVQPPVEIRYQVPDYLLRELRAQQEDPSLSQRRLGKPIAIRQQEQPHDLLALQAPNILTHQLEQQRVREQAQVQRLLAHYVVITNTEQPQGAITRRGTHHGREGNRAAILKRMAKKLKLSSAPFFDPTDPKNLPPGWGGGPGKGGGFGFPSQ